MCFGMIIPGMSFAIRYHVTMPIASLINGFYGPFCSFYFACMYDKAFQIPEKVGNIKRATRLRLAGSVGLFRNARQHWEAGEIMRRIRSVPLVGIQQERFGYLERESTPRFVDFVVSSVCSVLVSSK